MKTVNYVDSATDTSSANPNFFNKNNRLRTSLVSKVVSILVSFFKIVSLFAGVSSRWWCR